MIKAYLNTQRNDTEKIVPNPKCIPIIRISSEILITFELKTNKW